MKENNEKKIKNCDEISKLIKAFPKDIVTANETILDEDRKALTGEQHVSNNPEVGTVSQKTRPIEELDKQQESDRRR
jgi:hypothetical protein